MELLDAAGRGNWRVNHAANIWVPRWTWQKKQPRYETEQEEAFGLCATTACPLWALDQGREARGTSDGLSERDIMLGDMCTAPGCST